MQQVGREGVDRTNPRSIKARSLVLNWLPGLRPNKTDPVSETQLHNLLSSHLMDMGQDVFPDRKKDTRQFDSRYFNLLAKADQKEKSKNQTSRAHISLDRYKMMTKRSYASRTSLWKRNGKSILHLFVKRVDQYTCLLCLENTSKEFVFLLRAGLLKEIEGLFWKDETMPIKSSKSPIKKIFGQNKKNFTAHQLPVRRFQKDKLMFLGPQKTIVYGHLSCSKWHLAEKLNVTWRPQYLDITNSVVEDSHFSDRHLHLVGYEFESLIAVVVSNTSSSTDMDLDIEWEELNNLEILRHPNMYNHVFHSTKPLKKEESSVYCFLCKLEDDWNYQYTALIRPYKLVVEKSRIDGDPLLSVQGTLFGTSTSYRKLLQKIHGHNAEPRYSIIELDIINDRSEPIIWLKVPWQSLQNVSILQENYEVFLDSKSRKNVAVMQIMEIGNRWQYRYSYNGSVARSHRVYTYMDGMIEVNYLNFPSCEEIDYGVVWCVNKGDKPLDVCLQWLIKEGSDYKLEKSITEISLRPGRGEAMTKYRPLSKYSKRIQDQYMSVVPDFKCILTTYSGLGDLYRMGRKMLVADSLCDVQVNCTTQSLFFKK